MPRILPEVRRAVWDIYLAGTKGYPRILERLRENGFSDRVIPTERSIYRICRELEARYPPEEKALDRQFQISTNLPPPITKEDIPKILEIIKAINVGRIAVGDLGLTVRAVRWVAMLRHAMADDSPELTWLMADLYSQRERWSKIEQEELNTWDLDILLAYASWRSEARRQTYLAAVNCGFAPDIEEVVSRHIVDLHPLNRAEADQMMRHAKEREDGLKATVAGRLAFADSASAIKDTLPGDLKEAFEVYLEYLYESQGQKLGEDEFLRTLQGISEKLSVNYIQHKQEHGQGSVLIEEKGV